MNKKCTKCNIEKELTLFSNKKTAKDGKSTICKECTRLYTREHYKLNKQYYSDKTKQREQEIKEYIINIKKESCCSNCAENRWWVLDFHHLDENEKDFNIADAARHGYSVERINKELSKCIVVCSNCHRDIHYHNSL